MGRHRDMLISSKEISYSKFNKLCVRMQAINGRTGILNFTGYARLFIIFFRIMSNQLK